jgi:hypothetical protein
MLLTKREPTTASERKQEKIKGHTRTQQEKKKGGGGSSLILKRIINIIN